MVTPTGISPIESLPGLQPNEVRLIPFSPHWATIYSAESTRIRALLPCADMVCEHIGSTAVPGVYSKPIIDIMVGIKGTEHQMPFIEALEQAGYFNHGEKGIPGRMFLTMGDPRIFHIHVVAFNSIFWKQHIAFRDELVRNPTAARQYEKIKLALMKQFPHDRQSYTDGKAAIIESILDQANTPSIEQVHIKDESL